MPTAGDKIGLTVPTPGGDTGVWGTGLNTDAFPQIDELAYAPREDRNLLVTGGGKISWNSAANQASFTADIAIYNHVTDKIVSVTTAGSPVTLDTALKVGYVKINRKPGSNQSITSVTVAAAGALPNTNSDADSGVLALFVRGSSGDNSLWIPWARRELLSGDHWNFGQAMSWFERIASSGKPGFKSNADTSQLVCPGSATSPACVIIDGKVYANVADEILDLDTAGRGGLDTGAKAATTIYYLYAIPAASGRGFDLVCSVTGPGTGPTGFSSWSYLGSFGTVAASAIAVFTYKDGTFLAGESTAAGYEVTVTNASPLASKTLLCPTTISSVYLNPRWGAVNAIGDAFVFASESGSASITILTATSTTAANNQRAMVWVALTSPPTAYFNVTTVTTDSVTVRVIGWKENPMEFK
jgi:hypothetical protein